MKQLPYLCVLSAVLTTGCQDLRDEKCPDPKDPNVHYVYQNKEECQAALFTCKPWQTTFSDDCGCGCLGPAEAAICGGFSGSTCARGFSCVDDPRDACQAESGVDCIGFCIPIS